jgi:hypothetical protein
MRFTGFAGGLLALAMVPVSQVGLWAFELAERQIV